MNTYKRILAVFLFTVVAISVKGQAPDLISYQAVIRNASGILVVHKTVNVKISILKNGLNGSPVYIETHTIESNSNGTINLYIGNGNVSLGTFSEINWSSGTYFIKTETDPDGGNNYRITGTSQLLSVPYALYAKNAGNGFDGDYNKLINTPLFSPVATSGDYNDLSNIPDKQQLSIQGNTITLTDGGSIEIPQSFEGNYNNLTNLPDLKPVAVSGEYKDLNGIPPKQTLSIKDGNLVITGGDYLKIDPEFFKLPEGFSGNYSDLLNTPGKQKLSIKEGKLTLTGEKDKITLLEIDPDFSTLPAGFSGNYKELTDKPAKQTLSIRENKLYLEGGNEDTETLLNLGTSVELPSNSFSGNYNDLTNKPTGNNEGDIMYWSNNSWTILPMGQEGQVLSVADGKLTWIEPSYANTSASTYKIGDIFYARNGLPEGVIIEVSTVGRYGKIISLQETANKKWSTSHKTSGTTSETDGLENSRTIQRLPDWKTNYPAFAATVTEDNTWYLPSINEWAEVFKNKNNINNQLLAVGGTPLSGTFYWSSTESLRENDKSERAYATGIAMKSYTLPAGQGEDPITVLAGETYNDDKTIVGTARAIRRLSWAETTSKPVAGETYAIGNLYYAKEDKTVPIGVVYEITNGGLHGKIISLDEATSLAWSIENIVTNAIDTDNGKENTSLLSALPDNAMKYPANAWCTSKGSGWYMPSVNEMISICKVAFLLNVTLLEKGEKPIEDSGKYWTSTEINENQSYSVINTSSFSRPNTSKSTTAKVRAVYAF